MSTLLSQCGLTCRVAVSLWRRVLVQGGTFERHAAVYGHRPFLCERGSCSKAYKKLKELRRHVREHDEEDGEFVTVTRLIEDYACEEPGCNKVFKSRKPVSWLSRRLLTSGEAEGSPADHSVVGNCLEEAAPTSFSKGKGKVS